MSNQFVFDLRLARRKAGFTQRDIAHLLGTKKATIGQLEQAKRKPTLPQIVTLSVIYGRSFESLFSAEMRASEAALRQRIVRMPEGTRNHTATFNREASIERLAQRLATESNEYGDV